MCTVTFIPGKDAVFFTSNRDEKNRRAPALPPQVYTEVSGRLIYPKDGDAGGTWIAGHENGNVVVFLNGALEAHEPRPPYRKSRGLILLNLIEHSTPYNCFLAIKLNNIEPFTAVIRDNHCLFECRWDGRSKHYRQLDARQPHLWSSVTLYPEAVRSKRMDWFSQWLSDHPEPSLEDILDFHRFTGDGDTRNDLLMNRDGNLFTVSITSMAITDRAMTMDYLDLRNSERYSGMLFQTSMAGR